MKEKIVLDKASIKRALTRMSHEIIENNKGVGNLILIGIREGGSIVCERLKKCIEKFEGERLEFGNVDITLYRDDIASGSHGKVMGKTDIDFSLDGKDVILIDDVLYTGRTIRAAMDALMDFGRPKTIQLAVLVDRGHRELPIRADYVGKNIPTSSDEKIDMTIAGGELESVKIVKGE